MCNDVPAQAVASLSASLYIYIPAYLRVAANLTARSPGTAVQIYFYIILYMITMMI